jgi:hypothetical protein
MSMGEPANDESFLKSRVPFLPRTTVSMEVELEKLRNGPQLSTLSKEAALDSGFDGANFKVDNWVDISKINNPLSRIAEMAVDIIDYKFDEPTLLKELSEYVNSTYDQHYGKTKIQATEFILDQGLGIGFCVGNCIKYLQRYGKKDGYNRKDILKAIHYAIILLHTHDLEHAE